MPSKPELLTVAQLRAALAQYDELGLVGVQVEDLDNRCFHEAHRLRLELNQTPDGQRWLAIVGYSDEDATQLSEFSARELAEKEAVRRIAYRRERPGGTP